MAEILEASARSPSPRHRTSLSLEDVFWEALCSICRRQRQVGRRGWSQGEGRKRGGLRSGRERRRGTASIETSLSAAIRLYVLERNAEGAELLTATENADALLPIVGRPRRTARPPRCDRRGGLTG